MPDKLRKTIFHIECGIADARNANRNAMWKRNSKTPKTSATILADLHKHMDLHKQMSDEIRKEMELSSD